MNMFDCKKVFLAMQANDCREQANVTMVDESNCPRTLAKKCVVLLVLHVVLSTTFTISTEEVVQLIQNEERVKNFRFCHYGSFVPKLVCSGAD